MSEWATEERGSRSVDPGDRAVAILRELETHRTEEPEVGPIGSRLVARCIDLLLVGGVVGLVVYGVAVVWWLFFVHDADYYRNPQAPDLPAWVQVVSAVSMLVLIVAYDAIATRFFECTVGKRLLGLRIVRPDGRTGLPAGNLAWRSLLWGGTLIVLLLVPLGPPIARASFVAVIGLVLLAAHDRLNRALHDRLAGSRVVRPR